jgi:hypothetical protein
VHEDDLPAANRPEESETTVVSVLARLIARNAQAFTSHSAITAPAVLAGIGIAVHRTKP